jgi:hypothetical protein
MVGYLFRTVYLVHQASDFLQNFLSVFHLLPHSNYWLMRWRLIWTVGEQFMQHICSFSEVHSRCEYDDVCRSAVEFCC